MTLQDKLSACIIESLKDHSMKISQWHSVMDYVLGHRIPSMRMSDVQANMVLSFWETTTKGRVN